MNTNLKLKIVGYQSALEAAGAKVIDIKYFGSYQGDWLAFVEYKGEKGIVQGSYGSCSFCDAFQSEFDSYYDEDDFPEAQQSYKDKLSQFGKNYLESEGKPSLYSKEFYERKLSLLDDDDYFDSETKEMVEWALSMPW